MIKYLFIYVHTRNYVLNRGNIHSIFFFIQGTTTMTAPMTASLSYTGAVAATRTGSTPMLCACRDVGEWNNTEVKIYYHFFLLSLKIVLYYLKFPT